MHIKVCSSDSWNIGDRAAELVKRSSRGIIGADYSCLVKRAGEQFADTIRNTEMKPGEVPVHVISLGGSEKYGCFEAGTLISMGDGRYVPIERVAVGDSVLSGDGHVKSVVATFQREAETTLRLCVDGVPNEIGCSPNHPFRVARYEQFVCAHDKYRRCLPPTYGRQNICTRPRKARECVTSDYRSINWEWAAAETLREGDFVMHTCPSELPVALELSVEEGYLLGAWLAEGCYLKNGRTGVIEAIHLGIHVDETEFLQKLQFCAAALSLSCRDYNYADSRAKNGRQVAIRGNPARFRLWKELFNEYSTAKRLPPWLCSLPRPARLAIIAGYLDGDGSCITNAKDGRTTARTHGQDLAFGMRRLCWSVGLPAVLCHSFTAGGYAPNGEPCDTAFNLSVANSYLAELAQFSWKIRVRELVQTTKVHSFYNNGYVYLPVRSVLCGSAATVYNIEVEDDHNYGVMDVAVANSNRNGDQFTIGTLRKYHPTFLKYAKVYRHHANKDPKTSYGVVKAASVNEAMGRGELLLGLNETKEAAERNEGLIADKELEKLGNDEDQPYSMACLREDAVVRLHSGGRRLISLVKIGDEVYTHLGNCGTVTATMQRAYNGDFVSLTAQGLPRALVCTANHKIWIRRPSEDFEGWCAAADITTNDLVCKPEEDRIDFVPVLAVSCFHDACTVYNLTVEPDNSYVVDGVGVSNCKVSHDRCLGCGNLAKTRAEYCDEDTCKYGGCKNNLTKVAEDGFVLSVDNPEPTFFDISSVFRPADRIAYGNIVDYMHKSASDHTIGGSELGELYGITPPLQMLLENVFDPYTKSQIKLAHQLAALEDEIERSHPRWAQDIARAFTGTIPSVAFGKTAEVYRPETVLGALWQNQDILLSPRDFVCLATGDSSEKTAALSATVSGLLPGIYNRLIAEDDFADSIRRYSLTASQGLAPATLRGLSEKYAATHSVSDEALQRRIWQSAISHTSAPTMLQRPDLEKRAAAEPAKELASRYALYKLACLQRYANSDCLPLTCKAAIVQNYVSC